MSGCPIHSQPHREWVSYRPPGRPPCLTKPIRHPNRPPTPRRHSGGARILVVAVSRTKPYPKPQRLLESTKTHSGCPILCASAPRKGVGYLITRAPTGATHTSPRPQARCLITRNPGCPPGIRTPIDRFRADCPTIERGGNSLCVAAAHADGTLLSVRGEAIRVNAPSKDRGAKAWPALAASHAYMVRSLPRS